MSSVTSSPKHFNSIESKLNLLLNDHNFRCTFEISEICPEWWSRGSGRKEELKRHLDNIRNLQALCVTLQYKHRYDGRLDNEIETAQRIANFKTEITKLTDEGLYKALESVLYQIEVTHLQELRELTNDEENALNWLKTVLNQVACYIVRKTANYEAAKWAI